MMVHSRSAAGSVWAVVVVWCVLAGCGEDPATSALTGSEADTSMESDAHDTTHGMDAGTSQGGLPDDQDSGQTGGTDTGDMGDTADTMADSIGMDSAQLDGGGAMIDSSTMDSSTMDSSIMDSATEPQPGEDTTPAADASPTEREVTDQALVVWRGYEHTWLRTVVGFRIPHRISKFDSVVEEESHLVQEGVWSGQAQFRLGQNTGVDGNFMRPRGYYRAVYAPGIGVHRSSTRLSWVDDGDDSTYPQATTDLVQQVEVDLDRPELGWGEWDNYTLVLQGVKLNLRCEDPLQPQDAPCNSNGMWPHRFQIRVSECVRGSAETRMSCPLEVTVHRSWTPNEGGLPPLETKPFNDRLSFELEVFHTCVGGPEAMFHATRGEPLTANGRARDDDPWVRMGTIEGAPGYPHAMVAMTGFGFTLSPHRTDRDRFNHLGRYIGAWSFQLADGDYDPDSGTLNWGQSSHIWVPDTVVDSNVSTTVEAVALQFGPGSTVSPPGVVEGSLCANSDGAPFFSAWERCGSDDTGPEQREMTVPIQLP